MKEKANISEKDAQLSDLYEYLGRLLFENSESENLHYFFSQNRESNEAQVSRYFSKLRECSDFNDQNTIASGDRRTLAKSSIEMRGLLEGYSHLLVDIYMLQKDLADLPRGFDVLISLAPLCTDHSQMEAYCKELKDQAAAISSYLAVNADVIKKVMDKKREYLQDSKEGCMVPTWQDGEKIFFTQATNAIKSGVKQINLLVQKAAALCDEINYVYREDMQIDEVTEAGCEKVRQDLERKDERCAETDSCDVVDASLQEKDAPSDMNDVPQSTEDELLDSARRRLCNDSISETDKLDIVHMLLSTMPQRVPDFYCDLVKRAETRVRGELLSILKNVDARWCEDMYVRLVSDEDSRMRVQGIMGLSKISTKRAKELYVGAAGDSEAIVRRLVANCVSHVGSEAEFEALIQLANDTDESVARLAVRKLGKCHNRVSFMHLIPKLVSSYESVRKEAIYALEAMAGSTLGYRYNAKKEDRDSIAGKWQQLWERHQTSSGFLESIRRAVSRMSPTTGKVNKSKQEMAVNKKKIVAGGKKTVKQKPKKKK